MDASHLWSASIKSSSPGEKKSGTAKCIAKGNVQAQLKTTFLIYIYDVEFSLDSCDHQERNTDLQDCKQEIIKKNSDVIIKRFLPETLKKLRRIHNYTIQVSTVTFLAITSCHGNTKTTLGRQQHHPMGKITYQVVIT